MKDGVVVNSWKNKDSDYYSYLYYPLLSAGTYSVLIQSTYLPTDVPDFTFRLYAPQTIPIQTLPNLANDKVWSQIVEGDMKATMANVAAATTLKVSTYYNSYSGNVGTGNTQFKQFSFDPATML